LAQFVRRHVNEMASSTRVIVVHVMLHFFKREDVDNALDVKFFQSVVPQNIPVLTDVNVLPDLGVLKSQLLENNCDDVKVLDSFHLLMQQSKHRLLFHHSSSKNFTQTVRHFIGLNPKTEAFPHALFFASPPSSTLPFHVRMSSFPKMYCALMTNDSHVFLAAESVSEYITIVCVDTTLGACSLFFIDLTKSNDGMLSQSLVEFRDKLRIDMESCCVFMISSISHVPAPLEDDLCAQISAAGVQRTRILKKVLFSEGILIGFDKNILS